MKSIANLHQKIDKALQEHKVFGQLLDADSRQFLLENGVVRALVRGEVVCEKGDNDSSLFLILTGSVEVVDESPHGSTIIGRLHRGEIFGEISALFARPRIATVCVTTASVLLEVDGNTMEELMVRLPSIREAIFQRFFHRSVATALRSVSLFTTLSKESLAALSEEASLLKFSKGDRIVTEGEEGDAFFVISCGGVRVHVDYQTDQVNLAILKPGDFFGEWSLLTGLRRAASVTAQTNVEIIRISRDAFNVFLYNHPLIQKKVTRTARERHHHTLRIIRTPESAETIEDMLDRIDSSLNSCGDDKQSGL